MDAEGLRSACLRLLGGWHCRLTLQGANRSDGIAPAPIADWLRARSAEGDSGADVLSIAMQSARHPMLALRKAGAQLFPAAAFVSSRPQGADGTLTPLHSVTAAPHQVPSQAKNGPSKHASKAAAAAPPPTPTQAQGGTLSVDARHDTPQPALLAAPSAAPAAVAGSSLPDPYIRATALLSELALQVSQVLTDLEHCGGFPAPAPAAPMGFPPMFMQGGIGQAILIDLQGANAAKKLQVQMAPGACLGPAYETALLWWL